MSNDNTFDTVTALIDAGYSNDKPKTYIVEEMEVYVPPDLPNVGSPTGRIARNEAQAFTDLMMTGQSFERFGGFSNHGFNDFTNFEEAKAHMASIAARTVKMPLKMLKTPVTVGRISWVLPADIPACAINLIPSGEPVKNPQETYGRLMRQGFLNPQVEEYNDLNYPPAPEAPAMPKAPQKLERIEANRTMFPTTPSVWCDADVFKCIVRYRETLRAKLNSVNNAIIAQTATNTIELNTAGKLCKLAGLRDLAHMAELCGQSATTLNNFYHNKPAIFDRLLIGTVVLNNDWSL